MNNISAPKQNRRFLSLVIFLAALLLIFIHPADPGENAQENLVSNTRATIVKSPTTDSQLLLYQRVSDSLENSNRWKLGRLKPAGQSLYILFMGVNRVDECDTCIDSKEKSTRSKYFLSFNGFILKKNTGFRIEGNEYILDRYADEKKSSSLSTGTTTEEKKIGVRLAVPGPGLSGLTLLVPVSPVLYRVSQSVMYVLLIILVILGLWIFVHSPVVILVNIANGKAFVPQNVKHLKRIGWGILISVLVIILLPWLISLVLSSKIPGEIYYPVWPALLNYRWHIFLGFAILMAARAFKQGYQLQQEQNLTI